MSVEDVLAPNSKTDSTKVAKILQKNIFIKMFFYFKKNVFLRQKNKPTSPYEEIRRKKRQIR
jgi:hypothetical protein